MNEIQKELLELIGAARTHIRYRIALGVRSVGVAPSRKPSPETPPSRKPVADPARSVAPPAAPASAAPVAAALPEGAVGLECVRQELGACTRCKLHTGRKTIVFGEGDPGAALVFVGEGPGFEEDQQGRPFVGAAGQLLTDIIVKGMKLRREDVYICNIVKCRPPNNRNPEPDEVEACIGFVKQQIAAIRPKVIVTLGNVPTQSLLRTKEGITRMRGTWQMYEGIPVMPTFHPSYLLRSPGAKKEVWEDIKKVMERLGMEIRMKQG